MLRVGTENGPAIANASAEVSLLDALQARHRLRTLLKKRLSYLPVKSPLTDLFANTTALQSCSAVNFVVGEHFPEGATSWRDLKREARELLQPIVNGSAYLGRAKSSEHQIMPTCEHRLVTETLVTPTLVDRPTGRARVYRVTGYRLWSLTACVKKFFDEYLRERNTATKDKRKRQTNEEADPKRKKKKRRLDDDGASQDVEEPEVAAPVENPDSAALFSPLALGLEASFNDARGLQKRILVVREKEEVRRAKAKKPNSRTPVVAPESQPLVLQNVDVGSMMPFHYANATSVELFHWRAVVKYTRPNSYAFSTPGAKMTKGQIVDPRPHLTYSAQDEFDRSVPYTNRCHVLNPDGIFSKEGAMVYHTRNSADGKRLICSRQTNLGNYIQGVPAGYESLDEDQEEEPELLSQFGDDGEDAMDGLMRRINEDDASKSPFRDKLAKLIAENANDTANIQFPFPSLTKVVNRSMATPEGFAMLELPYPIGHDVTPEELAAGQQPMSEEDKKEMAAFTAALAEYEQMLNEENRHRNPNAPTKGILAMLSEELVSAQQHTDLQSLLQMKHVLVPELAAVVRDQVIEDQEHVVRNAIHREGDRARTDPYQVLFGNVSEVQSHNESMSISDFLPFAFVFRRDRMNIIRESVENHLRAQFYKDMESLAPEEKTRAEQRLRLRTERMVREIADKEVDDVAVYFLERDDLLKLRMSNQVKAGISKHEMAERVHTLRRESPPDLELKFVQTRNLYQVSLMNSRFKAADEVLSKLRTSNNIADTLKSPDFRAWYVKNCSPNMMVTLGAEHPIISHDATPFNGFIQLLADCSLTDLGIRASGLLLFFVALASALDSQTWVFNGLEPRINAIVNGATASGKSKIARSVQQMMSAGIVKSLSNFSTQAFTTATNMDNTFIVQEEGKASLLAPSDDDRKRGGSEMGNLIKDVLTRFESRATRATPDKETGVVNSVTSISSAHFAMMLLSNLNLTLIDPPLRRRFVVFINATLQGEASIQPEQFEQLDMFRDDFATRDNLRRMQITFGMYITLRSLIKAAVIPAPDRSQANMIIVAVLRELGLDTSSTDLHHFIQFAENYQLYYAAHMVCWSPYQAYYHASEESAERWTGQSIIELALPFTVEVSTPAVIFALTALEFMVIPKYLDSFLRDLVDLVNMARPEKRLYRRVDTGDRSRVSYDVNYVTVEGSSKESIIEMLASRNGMYTLRYTDMMPLIEKLNTGLFHGKSFRAESYRADNETPLLVGEDPASEILSYRPFEFEFYKRSTNQPKVFVMAVSLHFLRDHFKKDVLSPDEWRNMHEKPREFKERTFSMRDAESIGNVRIEDSPMARAIHNVLSTKVFQKASLEPNSGFPGKAYDFATAYAPAPVKLSVDVPAARNAAQPKEFRRGFDGVLMNLHIPRNPNRAPLVRENAHVPTPTVAEANRLRREVAKRAARKKNAELSDSNSDDDDNSPSLGNRPAYTSAVHDGDFVVQSMGLKKLGYVTPTCFLTFFGYTDEEMRAFSEGALRIPDPVALGFSPFAYLMQRKICRQMKIEIGKVVVPRDNIYAQLKNAMGAYRFKLTPVGLQSKQDEERISDINDVARDTLLGRVSFGRADEAEDRETDIMANFVGSLAREDIDAMDIDG